jgi:flagellar motor switch protein FliG
MTTQVGTTQRRLNGTERAAIILLALPQEQTVKVMEMLSEAEIREISKAMARLGRIEQPMLEGISHEFLHSAASSGLVVGSEQSTERLLKAALNGREGLFKSIMEDIRSPGGDTTWERISAVDAKVLADYLANEHPQTIAVVLSRVGPEHSARVLSLLPDAVASDVMLRILQLGPVSADILEDVERSLRNDLTALTGRGQGSDPHAVMADLVSRVDSDTEARLLGALEAASPETAGRVRRLMFTFDDLVKVGKAALQTLLQECDKSRLALALKPLDETVQQVFLGNMSERQAKLFREELETVANPRKPDVEAAQRELVALAKALAASGRLSLQPDEPEAAEAA